MSSTNKTTNYQLSQFVGSDKPAWLGDYNTDMSKIDTAIKSASDDGSEAKTQATTNKNAIGTLSNLSTIVKDNLVSAINEVKTTADNASTSSVGTARLTNGAVTTEKIEDGAVTGAKINLASLLSALVANPKFMQASRNISIAYLINNSAGGFVNVTFNDAFDTEPIVLTSIISGSGSVKSVNVSSVSINGFTINCRTMAGYQEDDKLSWIAIDPSALAVKSA